MADVPTTAIKMGGIAVTPDGALYVTGDAGASIGDSVGGGTATRVLYLDTGPVLANSANLTFDGTSLTAGGFITTGTFRGGSTGGTLAMSNTAGAGATIAAGTATTDVRPLTITGTWNAAGVTFEGILYTITDTASAAGSLAMQILGGASGTTNLISVSKAGLVTTGASVLAHGATAIPAGGTAGAGLLVSSTSNFGVFFGSGAPSLSAAKGSLYLRSDGTGVADRCYVNTDSGTTWTAIATAA